MAFMRQNESGNVFVYIFLAIALLASLSYAVSQGGRVTGSQLTQDTRNLVATEILGFGDTVAKAVTQLRLRGTAMNSLSFANPFLSSGEYGTYGNDPDNEIFNPAGGAVVYQSPPTVATTSGTEEYEFLANNEIQEIGSTCGASSCSDLIMVIPNMQQSVCIRINELLDVTNPTGVPPTDSDIREAEKFIAGASPFGYDETVGDEDADLAGQKEACFEETGDSEFVYFKVLIPR